MAFLCPIAAQTDPTDDEPIETDTTDKKKKPKVKISGMIQVHFLEKFDTNGDGQRDPDGFRILRARLRAEGKVNRFTSYKLSIDPRSPEHNGLMRDAFIAFRLAKQQSLRVGQQKTQFGLDNTESTAEKYVVNRSEMSDNIQRGRNLRDAGLGLIGKIPLNAHFFVENAITFTNSSGLNLTGPSEFSPTKNIFGRLGIRYRNKEEKVSARFGLSGGKGRILDTGDDDIDPSDDFYIYFRRVGAHAEVDHPRFFAVAEYAIGPDKEGGVAENRIGYYATLVMKTRWDIGPLVRFDALDDEYKRTTIGAYYGKPKARLRFLLNYEMRGGIKDQPGGHDDRLYLQAQVTF